MLCLLSALLIWRCSDYFLEPELRAEDGAKVFAYFYVHREFSTLFRFKAGYLPFLPNLIGYLSVRVPARATPYFLTIVPALLTLTTFSVLRASAYRRFIRRDGLRFVLCVVLALSPIGNFFTACHTDYSIWNALLLLMLLVVLPMPRSFGWALAFSLLVTTLIWSHPMSIVALPASLLWIGFDRGAVQRALHGLLAACQLIHVWLGTRPENAVISKSTDPIWVRLGEVAMRAINHLCRGIIRPAVLPFGPGGAEYDYAVVGLLALGLLACALIPRRRLVSRVFYAWVGYGIAAPMLVMAVARAERGLQSTRYYYVSRAFTTIALCLLISQLLFSLLRRLSRRVDLVPVAATVLLLAYLNRHSGKLTLANPENARSVARFFAMLAEEEAQRGGHCGIHLSCRKRHGDWSFEVDTRQSCQ